MEGIPIRIETVLSCKRLDFINEIDLRNDLLARLAELDRVVLANANYSTVFLAIGIIEGIFKHIANIYKAEIRSSTTYPRVGKELKLKPFGKLSIDELYLELKTLGIASAKPDYQQLYDLFRHYRNNVHPQVRFKKGWKVELGQAQMALGLLNATIQNLDRNVFVGKHILEKISGSPYYDSEGVLRLPMNCTPHCSFVVLKQPVNDRIEISFNLDLSEGSIVNFVFNYDNEGDFKMVRLDSRPGIWFGNSVLASSQKYDWRQILFATKQNPPSSEMFPVTIIIDIPNGIFDFVVDDTAYTFKDRVETITQLFSLLRPGLRVGLFNEVGPVKLTCIKIETS